MRATKAMKEQLADADYQSLAAFRRSIREFLSFSESAARENGLTPQQHQAILAIRGLSADGDMSVGSLAGHLMVQHHSAVELVDRLEHAGLIKRVTAADDRRKVNVRLTPKAHRLLEQLSRVHLSELRRRAPELAKILHDLSSDRGVDPPVGQ
jgi:DNA-binding MarR family transcriptional regulator